MNSYKIVGTVFMIMSGFLYSIERGFSMLSSSMIRAGFFAGGMTGEAPVVLVNGFFSNLFVPFFLLIGFIFFVYGVMKKIK